LKLSRLKYSFSEAKKNVIRNGLMSVASLFTISCCLFILGVFLILSINVNSMTEQIKDQCEIQIYIDPNASPERVAQIGEEARSVPNVKEATHVTKEEAFEYVKNDVFKGKEDLLAGIEDSSFLPDAYKIVLNDIGQTAATVSALEKITDVYKVENRQDVVNGVLSLSNTVKRFSIVIMLVLLIIAIVIISNTVKLTVFNRRREINIMKYIGATDRFIRIPFVLEGLIIGFLGAVLAFLVVFWGYFALVNYMENSLNFGIFKLVRAGQVAPMISVIFVVFGSLIGVVGSTISMRKHLHV